MKKIFYTAFESGKIRKDRYSYPARFLAVKKYEILYRTELPRFRTAPYHIYGLPYGDVPKKQYHGVGRDGHLLFSQAKKHLTQEQETLLHSLQNFLVHFDETIAGSEDTMLAYLDMYENCEEYEVIWTRIYGSEEKIPFGYRFLGYDISYPPEQNEAFSMICDCMFICRFRGCDEDGTLFQEDFQKLNEHGLFDDVETAYTYMMKYLSQDFGDKGTYGIFEVYGK
ncbi:MAG: hypothetical protein J6D19_01725 [Clostridia bacterium]|nr:hypothetical protein [Clostridia bacterium]